MSQEDIIEAIIEKGASISDLLTETHPHMQVIIKYDGVRITEDLAYQPIREDKIKEE